jgi:glycine/D-amino acid oxidase-like deaminating enzyme
LTQSSHTKFEPFWWEAAPLRTPQAVAIQQQCDVAIVGAGYTGLSAGLALAKAGRSVQIFEKDRPGEGASTRNGGITSGTLRISLASAITKFGLRKGTALYREGVDARNFLRDLITENAIDCDFKMSGRFTGALGQADYDELCREGELLNEHIGIEAYAVSKADLSGETGSKLYYGGLIRPDIGQFDPGKFFAGLLNLCSSAGALIHSKTPVLGFKKRSNGFEVHTSAGSIFARNVIFATNGYTDQSNPWLRKRLVPVKSRIIVTEELSPNLMHHLMPKGRGMGEVRALYRYYRPTPDGKRVLLGGREPAFGGGAENGMQHLRRSLIQIFPDLRDARITHSWSGNVAFSREQLPRLFERDGIQYAVGYCGSGTVWATWLGRKAALRILGHADAHSEFFDDPPKSIPLYGGKPWFLPAAMVYYGAKDRIKMRA